MYVFSKDEINEHAICVLKCKSKSKLIDIDYIPITKSLEKEFKWLLKKFNKANLNAKSIIKLIKKNNKLNVLLHRYDYCISLNSAFQGFWKSMEEIEDDYKSDFIDSSNIEESEKYEKERLQCELKHRLKAYYLNQMYPLCEQKLINKKILAYSHRKVGWSTPKYHLNKDFSVEIKTNFGYGRSSYFYTRICYKGLDIIGFADWIIYRYAMLFEIVQYSSSHPLNNYSWFEAMGFLRNACNLSINNEKLFLEKYIIKECENLVLGLEEFLSGNTFSFCDYRRIFTDERIEGHELIEFRGMKISGALSFISNIIAFEKVSEIYEFVERIEKCNRKVQPLLTKEIELIEIELIDKNLELEIIKPKYDKMHKKNALYIKDYDILREERIKRLPDESFSPDEVIIEKYPEYEKFKSKYDEIELIYDSISNKIISLEYIKDKISEYNDTIEKYFKDKITVA